MQLEPLVAGPDLPHPVLRQRVPQQRVPKQLVAEPPEPADRMRAAARALLAGLARQAEQDQTLSVDAMRLGPQFGECPVCGTELEAVAVYRQAGTVEVPCGCRLSTEQVEQITRRVSG